MITSLANKEIKQLFKLKLKKYRDQTNTFLVFGEHLIEEAIKTNNIVKIYSCNPLLEGELISEEIMNKLKDTKTIFDRLAVVKKLEKRPYSNKILILDDVRDPLNVGSLMRSGAGFGFETIITSERSVDFYNDKVIRASQGTLFYLNLIKTDLIEIIKELKALGYYIIGTDLHADNNLKSLKGNEKMVIILGSEGNGISEEVKNLTDKIVTIKTNNIESLNVSHAGAILMYEAYYE